MKLMTYNILNGGEGDFDAVIQAINNEYPDFLTINEANGFDANNSQKLKEFSGKTELPYYHLALSGEYDYHVAVFSKKPFKESKEIKPLMRAAISVLFETDFGDLSIIGTHLTPYTEDLRLPEIDLIAAAQKYCPNKILMGDMNSLSPSDGYEEKIISELNEMQLKKYTTDGKLRFDAISKIMSLGYTDTALIFNKEKESTAPTSINEYQAHSNMRLDYIFVSESLKNKIANYSVIKNPLTDKVSDHYPVTVELKI